MTYKFAKPNESIAKVYRAARVCAGWSRHDLASRIGLTRDTITRFEQGGRLLEKNFEKLTQVLEVEAGIVFVYKQGVPVGVRYKELNLDQHFAIRRNKYLAKTGYSRYAIKRKIERRKNAAADAEDIIERSR